MIELAMRDCLQVGKDGRPTQLALDSYTWLASKTDWTRYGRPAPPPELRPELYLTFDWCCAFLSENPDEVRAGGLPERSAFVPVENRGHRDHIKGLPDIQRRWTIAASRCRPY